MAADAWDLIHAERAALADDLAQISQQQWATPSWCVDWSVHQALAHILATTTMKPARFLTRFAAAGFNFTKFNARNVAANTRANPADTLADFRAHLRDSTAPRRPGRRTPGSARS